jgi:hypothetical protein
MFSAGETVRVIRPAVRDEFGDRTATPSSFDIEGCAIIQQSTTDNNGNIATVVDGRQTAITIIELLCPPGADIRQGDHVQIGDTKFLVDGLPWRPHNPFTAWEPGRIVRLRGVK